MKVEIFFPDINQSPTKKTTSILTLYIRVLTTKKIYILPKHTDTVIHTILNLADTFQQILEEHSGVLLIRELPDTVKSKETEAEAYSALWDLMIQIEKDLPMAYVFYGQDSLIENDKRYDELGIFLPNSHFLKNLEKHVEKAEAIIYGK